MIGKDTCSGYCVDIMLVLLVIFMVVAPLAVQGIDINLPNAPADEIELENSQPFTIDVSKDGKYFIEEDGSNVQVSLGFIEDRFSKVISANPNIEIICPGVEKYKQKLNAPNLKSEFLPIRPRFRPIHDNV